MVKMAKREGLCWGVAATLVLLVACNGGDGKSSPDYKYLPEDTVVQGEVAEPVDTREADQVQPPVDLVPDLCLPQCDGLECGPDGCGGICGQCEDNQDVCQEGLCVCVPACAGKECGDDGCGGDCSQCEAPYVCEANKCECEPNCEGKECGYDGCFGECGFCSLPLACDNGTCTCAYGACAPGDDLNAVCGGTSLGNCGFWACNDEGCCVVDQTPPPECCQVSDDCRDCINLDTAEIVPCPDAIPEGFVTHKCTKDVCGNNQCKHFDKVVFGECNDDDPCTTDACDPDSGVCTHNPVPDCTS